MQTESLVLSFFLWNTHKPPYEQPALIGVFPIGKSAAYGFEFAMKISRNEIVFIDKICDISENGIKIIENILANKKLFIMSNLFSCDTALNCVCIWEHINIESHAILKE